MELLSNSVAMGLHASGAANEIKAKLRSIVAQQLLKSASNPSEQREDSYKPSLEDSIVFDYLRQSMCTFTLPVFVAERPQCSSSDALASLGAIATRLGHTTASVRCSSADTQEHGTVLQRLVKAAEEFYLAGGPDGIRRSADVDGDRTITRRTTSLSAQLAEADARVTGAVEIAELRASFAAQLEAYQRAADARSEAEVESRLASLRVGEIARVKAEERLRFETELSQIRRGLDADRAREAAAARADVDCEIDALRRTREAAATSASELRARLLGELDRVASQDVTTRRAATQDARVVQLERERAEDIERRLTARVTEAEDAARHADVKARLALERWKAEASLALEERERALERAERRAQDECAAAEAERRSSRDQLARLPQLSVDLAAAQTTIEELRRDLQAARAGASEAAARAGALSVSLDAERAARIDLDKRYAVMESARQRAEGDLAAARSAADASGGDWAAAVHLLRDKLAAALSKQKRLAADLAAERASGRERLQSMESAEQLRAREAESAFAREVRSHEARHAGLQAQLSAEQRRSDDLAAQLAGSQQRCAELQRTVADQRAQLSAGAAGAAAAAVASAATAQRPVVTVAAPPPPPTAVVEQPQVVRSVAAGPAAAAAAAVLAKGAPARLMLSAPPAFSRGTGSAAALTSAFVEQPSVSAASSRGGSQVDALAAAPAPLQHTPAAFAAFLADWNSSMQSTSQQQLQQQQLLIQLQQQRQLLLQEQQQLALQQNASAAQVLPTAQVVQPAPRVVQPPPQVVQPHPAAPSAFLPAHPSALAASETGVVQPDKNSTSGPPIIHAAPFISTLPTPSVHSSATTPSPRVPVHEMHGIFSTSMPLSAGLHQTQVPVLTENARHIGNYSIPDEHGTTQLVLASNREADDALFATAGVSKQLESARPPVLRSNQQHVAYEDEASVPYSSGVTKVHTSRVDDVHASDPAHPSQTRSSSDRDVAVDLRTSSVDMTAPEHPSARPEHSSPASVTEPPSHIPSAASPAPPSTVTLLLHMPDVEPDEAEHTDLAGPVHGEASSRPWQADDEVPDSEFYSSSAADVGVSAPAAALADDDVDDSEWF